MRLSLLLFALAVGLWAALVVRAAAEDPRPPPAGTQATSAPASTSPR